MAAAPQSTNGFCAPLWNACSDVPEAVGKVFSNSWSSLSSSCSGTAQSVSNYVKPHWDSLKAMWQKERNWGFKQATIAFALGALVTAVAFYAFAFTTENRAAVPAATPTV